MNVRTIRRPVHNGSAAFEAIVRQHVAERAAMIFVLFQVTENNLIFGLRDLNGSLL